MRSLFTTTVLLTFLGLLAGTRAGGEEEREALPFPMAGLALPRIGTLGQAPRAPEAIVVGIEKDGALHVDGKDAVGLDGLNQALRGKTADPLWRNPDRTSKHSLLVVADASVPWIVAQWVLQTAAHPIVAINNVSFAARPLEGDEVGAIACPLPQDRAAPDGGAIQARTRLRLKLSASPNAGSSAPYALFAAISAQARPHGGAGKVSFRIRTPPPYGPRVPTGTVIQVLDVLARAGVRTVTFEGAAIPLGGRSGSLPWLREQVAELGREAGKARISLGGVPIGSEVPEGSVPEPQGLLRRTYGFLDPTTTGDQSEEELLDDEVGDLPRRRPPLTTAAARRVAATWDEEEQGTFPVSFGARQRDDEAAPPDRRRHAIEDALRWLAAHQSDHGGWEAASFGRWCDGKRTSATSDGKGKAEYDVGVTGLALLAFSGAGYTYRGTHPYAKVVRKGLRRLEAVQDADGCFGPRAGSHCVYDHAIATLAMVEAYGMTLSPLLKDTAQRGLDFIAHARNPYFAWRYGIKPGVNDTSVTAWMISALHAARLVNRDARSEGRPEPFEVDEASFEGARAWLAKMTEPDFGRTGYIQRGGSSSRPQDLIDQFPGDRSEAMTAAAICIRVAIGESAQKSLAVRKGVRLVLPTKPVWNPDDGSIDMIGWYFGSLALYQVGGSAWSEWRRATHKALLGSQRRDGNACGLKGSWNPSGPWGPDGGRVYATALMALVLETPERYPRR